VGVPFVLREGVSDGVDEVTEVERRRDEVAEMECGQGLEVKFGRAGSGLIGEMGDVWAIVGVREATVGAVLV
jgi:hypothetical protein